MRGFRAWLGSPRVGALLGGAAGLCEGLRAIGHAVAWPDRAVLVLWSSVALGAMAGLAFGVMGGSGTGGPRLEPVPSPGARARGALRLVDAVAGASLLGFGLWAAILPFQDYRVRAVLASAVVGAAAVLMRGRRALLPPPGFAALAFGAALWWLAPRIGLDRMLECFQSGDRKPPPVLTASGSRPNLLLVVLDTVRADRLTPYGAPRDTTPSLSRLAHEGTLFLNAISSAPWTLPSHTSIFTGQFPSVHRTTTENLFLDPSIPTLAERLHERGYDTVGYSANVWVGPSFGLQRGFEDFAMVGTATDPRDDPFRRHIVFGALLDLLGEPQSLPDKGGGLENRLARRWLDQHMRRAPERPFFLFMNYLEAHLPYTPAAGPRARFAPGRVRSAIAPLVTASFSFQALFRLIALPHTLELDDYRQLADYYDASVASDDALLNELIQDLDRRGLLDNTLVVVTSDHGENLGEHGGLINHSLSVHQTLLHVPLLVRHPATFPAGLRYPGLVSTVSIFPTLLEAAGATPAPGWEPAVPSLPHTATAPPLPFAVSEYSLPVWELSLLALAVPGTDVGPFAVRQRAIQDGTHKLVVRSDGGEALYDLAQDPSEGTPLPAGDEAAASLRAALERWLASLPVRGEQRAGGHLEMDPNTLRSLRALGYVK
ncbi:MAG TPA: sulfatase-like hydrolase/transferase [Myxococcota bacterium]|nr:sulfatase-like hydrolase/transferase [Myxococcota bacterium]